MESDNSVSGQHKQSPVFDKPWFKEAYKSAVEFYKIDDNLDARDRLALSETYRSFAKAQVVGGWLGFSGVFLTPFAYQYYRTKAIRGVKVPRNFMLGILAMFATTNLTGNYAYSRKLKELDPDGRLANRGVYGDDEHEQLQLGQIQVKSPQEKQYEMLSLLKNGSPTMWASYFYMTYKNPSKRFPDPRLKLDEMKNGGTQKRSTFLNQRDPIGLYTGPGHEKQGGITGIAPDTVSILPSSSNNDSGNTWAKLRSPESNGSSWEHVRNGSYKQPSPKESEDDDPFGFNTRSQQEFDNLLKDERQSHNQK